MRTSTASVRLMRVDRSILWTIRYDCGITNVHNTHLKAFLPRTTLLPPICAVSLARPCASIFLLSPSPVPLQLSKSVCAAFPQPTQPCFPVHAKMSQTTITDTSVIRTLRMGSVIFVCDLSVSSMPMISFRTQRHVTV